MPNAEEVKRCLSSKNPCGTDTWQAGKPCPCENCQEWIDSTLLERTGELNDLRRKLEESERVKNDTIKLCLGDQAQWQKGIDSYKAELDASRAENEKYRSALDAEFLYILSCLIMFSRNPEWRNTGDNLVWKKGLLKHAEIYMHKIKEITLASDERKG